MGGVDYDVDGPICRITMTAPRLGWGTMKALTTAPQRAVEDGARVLLLTAQGPDFSHGVDLADPELADMLRADGGIGVATAGQALVDGWARAPLPTVVALQGRVIGAGACLAVASEFRFAAPDTTIAFPEVARGMHLSWGILPRLVSAFGLDWARWLAVGGQPVGVAALGLAAARVVEAPIAAATAWAHHLAALAPLAVVHIREVLAAIAAGDPSAAADDPARFAATAASADFAEAMAAWFEKRAPVFRGK